ncbi:MAG: Hsp70 family protein [Candidatus Riflebacteria bacterium]|nr:Hsp70 family protein [Candidatus Riflebacteria bacterium]
MATPRYLIGIDLGTTQTALSYLDLEDPAAGIRTFPIPQLVSSKQVEGQPTLPSVVFLHDDPAANPGLPWDAHPDYLLGQHARDLGLEIPVRLVHSAKSWLCHPRVDRQGPILPWQSEEVARRLSPVQATTALLEHLRRAWDALVAKGDRAAAFLRQQVIVTVPASFDPVARNLTLQAIQAAGLDRVTLLEEPQAAFYDFIYRNPDTLRQELDGVRKVLVIDIGGGTTDFSLIQVDWPGDGQHPAFERLAVGPHLLIGGDNLDLAIAHLVEGQLRHKGRKLAAKQWLAVLNQSRLAKEQALADDAAGTARFTLSGTGSRVIGQTVTEEIDRARIREVLVEGFFPRSGPDELPAEDAGLGISEAGLPYCRDAAVPRHLAAFLAPNGTPPEAVLFNGGTMISPLLRQRLLEILGDWRGGGNPRELHNPHPTLAVAAGAVYYGMVARGLGHRIRSGNPVSLYLGIGTDTGSNAHRHVPERVLCVLPKGAVAEKPFAVADKAFGIDLGHDAAFYLYFSPAPPKTEAFGGLYKYAPKRHLPLPPLRLPAEPGSGVRQVRLETMLRETGYLQIRCQGVDEEFQRDLAFDLSPDQGAGAEDKGGKRKAPLNKRQQGQVKKLLEGLATGADPNQLFKELGEAAGQPREAWDVDLLRAVFDLAIEEKTLREQDETFVWWVRLLGYCLRPGFGAPGDPARVDRVWALADGPLPARHPVFWSEWWLMLKRIAPGLSSERQAALVARIEPFLFPPKRFDKAMRQVDQHERNHLWRLLGHLERVPVPEKERLGWWALKAPLSFGRDAVALYAVGRLGARLLAYGPPEGIIHQSVANQWVEFLLPRSVSGGGSYLDWALRELGRKTADRLVRIDDVLRKRIVDQFRKAGKKKAFLDPLLEVHDLQADDYAQFCGESLPSGFVWVQDLPPATPAAD